MMTRRSSAALLIAISCVRSPPASASSTEEPAMVLQTGHSQSIGALAFSSSRTLLATAAADSQLLLWDVSSGLLVSRIRLPETGSACATGFTSDGRLVFAAGTFGVYGYDVASGRRRWRIDDTALFAASSPGADRLIIYSGSTRRALDVIDLRTGSRTKSVPIRAANPGALALSQDGQYVAVGDLHEVPTLTPQGLRNNPGTLQNRIVVYEVATGKPTRELPTESSWVSGVTFSPDGSLLGVASYEKTSKAVNTYSGVTVEIFNLPSGTRRAKVPIPLQLSRVSALAFNDGASQLGIGISGNDAGQTDGELLLSDLTGRATTAVSPIGPVWTLAYGGEGLWAGAGRSTQVQLWDANVGVPSLTLRPQSSPATTVAFDPSNSARLIVSTKAGQTQLFDLKLGIVTTVPISDAVVSENLVAGHSGFAGNAVYRIQGRDKTTVLTTRRDDFEQSLSLVALDPSGRYFAESLHRYGNKTTQVRVWDLENRTQTFTVNRVGPTRRLEMLPAAGALVIEDAQGLSVWNLTERKSIAEVDDPAESVDFYVDTTTSTIQRIAKSSNLDRSADRSIVIRISGATASIERNAGLAERIRKVGPGRMVFVPETAFGKQLVAADWHTGQRIALDYVLQDSTGATYRRDAQNRMISTTDARRYEGTEELSLPFTRQSAVTPDAAWYIELTYSGDVLLWSLETGRFQGTLRGNDYPITSWMFTADGKQVVVATEAGDATVWNLNTQKAVGTLVSLDDGDWMVLDAAKRYFFGSRRGELKLAYRVGLEAVPFEQFDLLFNRPDIVLRAFGLAPRARITAAERAYEARRAASLAAVPAQAAGSASLPAVASRPSAISTADAAVDFKIEAMSSTGLARLHVFNNDAPVVGVDGRALSGATEKIAVTVPLAIGVNEITVSVVDLLGVESLRRVSRIMRLGSADSQTYVVAVGVSNYTNPALFLTRAAQDAREVASAFKNMKGFRGPEPLVLTDTNVAADLVSRISLFIRGATPDDQLVVYLAGHGTNSPKDGYRFILPLSAAMDDQYSVPFEAFEQLLAASAPIRKLLFLDTCFAGGAAQANQATDTDDGEWRNYDLLDDLVDLRRGSGAVVIAASRATEVSFDRLPSVDVKHGIFAHAVIESLLESKADANADGHLRVSELKSYVFDRVEYLSSGLMTPVTRNDNIRNDFAIR